MTRVHINEPVGQAPVPDPGSPRKTIVDLIRTGPGSAAVAICIDVLAATGAVLLAVWWARTTSDHTPPVVADFAFRPHRCHVVRRAVHVPPHAEPNVSRRDRTDRKHGCVRIHVAAHNNRCEPAARKSRSDNTPGLGMRGGPDTDRLAGPREHPTLAEAASPLGCSGSGRG